MKKVKSFIYFKPTITSGEWMNDNNDNNNNDNNSSGDSQVFYRIAVTKNAVKIAGKHLQWHPLLTKTEEKNYLPTSGKTCKHKQPSLKYKKAILAWVEWDHLFLVLISLQKRKSRTVSEAVVRMCSIKRCY